MKPASFGTVQVEAISVLWIRMRGGRRNWSADAGGALPPPSMRNLTCIHWCWRVSHRRQQMRRKKRISIMAAGRRRTITHDGLVNMTLP